MRGSNKLGFALVVQFFLQCMNEDRLFKVLIMHNKGAFVRLVFMVQSSISHCIMAMLVSV